MFDHINFYMHDMQFLRLKINDYNHTNMNSVHISNQFSDQYIIDQWIQNTIGGGHSFGGVMVRLL